MRTTHWRLGGSNLGHKYDLILMSMWQGALLLQNDLAYHTTSILSKKQTNTQNYMV